MPAAAGSRRNPFALGWEAARANLIPALFIQFVMLGLVLGYYFSPPVARALEKLAALKARSGLLFVFTAAILAGSLLPELFVVFFFQRGRLTKQNFRNLLFTIPIWCFDGSMVDLLYRGEAALLGNVVQPSVVLGKICIDQFLFNPFFAAPFGILTYEWKNSGFSTGSLGRAFRWWHYREKVIPTLLATWAVWIPMMAMIYSLPLALQFPLFTLALTFWVLLLTYMTNSFAAKNERAAAEVVSSAIAEISP